MKRLQVILKDLQDSGQQVTIIGQYALQLSQFQDVTESNNVRVLPDSDTFPTNESKNPNRYTTEHGRHDVDGFYATSQPVALPPDLLEVVDVWAALPDTLRAGIMAMVRTVASQ